MALHSHHNRPWRCTLPNPIRRRQLSYLQYKRQSKMARLVEVAKMMRGPIQDKAGEVLLLRQLLRLRVPHRRHTRYLQVAVAVINRHSAETEDEADVAWHGTNHPDRLSMVSIALESLKRIYRFSVPSVLEHSRPSTSGFDMRILFTHFGQPGFVATRNLLL